MTKSYDIAAYIWPAYHDEPRWRRFMPEGIGEWETARKAKPQFEGHYQPRVPLWGYTSESNPKDMERMIDAAVKHHVNVFIFDWYWYDDQPFLEEALNKGFLQAKNHDQMNFYLMWANHDATTLWDLENSHEHKVIWPGTANLTQFKTIMERVITRYFSQPCYYTIDGCPVFSIFQPKTIIKGLGGMRKTKKALELFRQKVKEAGFPDLHIKAILNGVKPKMVKKLQFDSITSYNWAMHVRAEGPYKSWAEKNIAKFDEFRENYATTFYPHVSVGWDTSPRFKAPRKDVIVNNEPELFEEYMGQAMDYIDQHAIDPPLITVNSWNEWYLEPDMKYGMAYLEAVKNAYEKNAGE